MSPDDRPLETSSDAGEPGAAASSQEEALEPAAADSAVVPRHVNATHSRYFARFAALYAGLGAVLAAGIAGVIVLAVIPSVHRATPWSSWAPNAGSTATVTHEIAEHVAAQYRLNKTTPLLAVISEAPEVTNGTSKIAITAIAIKDGGNYNIYSTSGTWVDEFCGLGEDCSISSGQATETRGQLVRREALEVALYTFKYAPGITSLIAYMPPPPGEAASTVLFFQKSALSRELSEPLNKTLPLATPPLPTVTDTIEAGRINQLTVPDLFSYSLVQAQDGGAALVLDPSSS